MAKPTPAPWEAYDPCYGTCEWGAMPCTPNGCPENHPVGVRCVAGPPGIDGDIELENEADARLISAAPDLADQLRLDIVRFRNLALRLRDSGMLHTAEKVEAFAREAEAVLRRAVPEERIDG
jgi:hypothetical protein